MSSDVVIEDFEPDESAAAVRTEDGADAERVMRLDQLAAIASTLLSKQTAIGLPRPSCAYRDEPIRFALSTSSRYVRLSCVSVSAVLSGVRSAARSAICNIFFMAVKTPYVLL